MRYIVKCCAIWCGAVENDNPSLKFFRFPPEENQMLYDAWANYSGNQRLLEGRCKQAWLCQEHFASPSFKSGHDLVYDAIPSIPPPHVTPSDTLSLISSMDLKTDEMLEEKSYVAPTSPNLTNNGSPEFFDGQVFPPVSTCSSPCLSVESDDRNMGTFNVSFDRNLPSNQRKRKHLFSNNNASRIDEFTPPKRRLYETIMKRIVR